MWFSHYNSLNVFRPLVMHSPDNMRAGLAAYAGRRLYCPVNALPHQYILLRMRKSSGYVDSNFCA